jgi:8-oxo-dGTP pyrophosphatase MutT (NUDIX family)
MLTIQRDLQRFQVRAAALVRHDGWVLLHRARGDTFWTLPGGRVEFGEDSAATMIREMREELGVEVRCAGLAFVAETFFAHLGEEVHEIAFIFFAELPSGSPLLEKEALHPGIEADRALEFQWLRESALAEAPVYPALLRTEALGRGDFPRYVVEREEVRIAGPG